MSEVVPVEHGAVSTTAALRVAGWITRMRISSPDIVRSISVDKVLRRFGRILRDSSYASTVHQQSCTTEVIEQFWSHSWQLPPHRKIITLMILMNGVSACVAGTTAAILAAVCAYLGVLPPQLASDVPSFWCLLFGASAFLLTLLIGLQKANVFLDIACIDQHDTHRKKAGIASIGGILKRSEAMLILWDHTWATRLWCVFEAAAFLVSRPAESNIRLLIRPTLLGPCWASLFVGISIVAAFNSMTDALAEEYLGDYKTPLVAGVLILVAFAALYLSSDVLRSYYSSVDNFHEQLRNFRLADAKCGCCTTGHPPRRDGHQVLCDREVLTACIRNWYGTEGAFEDTVRSIVSVALQKQLGQRAFPLWLVIVAGSPMFWCALDVSIANIQTNWGVWWIFNGLSLWLGSMPITAACLLEITWKFRQRRTSKWKDRFLNLVTLAVVLSASVSSTLLPILCYTLIPGHVMRGETQAGLVALVNIFIAWLAWNPWLCNCFCQTCSSKMLPCAVRKKTDSSSHA